MGQFWIGSPEIGWSAFPIVSLVVQTGDHPPFAASPGGQTGQPQQRQAGQLPEFIGSSRFEGVVRGNDAEFTGQAQDATSGTVGTAKAAAEHRMDAAV